MSNELNQSFNQLDNNFIQSYKSKTGFWYAFKRSVNDLGNLWLIFNVFKNFENENWIKNQEEFSSVLISEKLLSPTLKYAENMSANSRGIKKVFEQMGFCYVDKDGILKITECGFKFLNAKNNDELLEIKTQQLLKYQINNPIIKANNFKLMQIKPFVFLLKLLLKIDNQSISTEEYKLFVSRSYSLSEIDDVNEQIKHWRNIKDYERDKILSLIKISEVSARGATIYEKISGYSAYSMEFFGNSNLTKFTEFNDEKFISLNFDKIEEINNILMDENLTRYRFDLSDLDKFMNFYGSSSTKKFDKLDNKIELKNNIKDQVLRLKLESLTEKVILKKKITELFELKVATLNALEKEGIIHLDDLLMWDEINLKRMQGLGQTSVDTLKTQINELNKLHNLKFHFGYYNKNLIIDNNEQKENDSFKVNNNIISFFDMKEDDQINFFMSVENVFDNVRSLNVLKNLGLDYLGDLHQNIHLLMKSVNFGRKSMSIVQNTLKNYISLTANVVIEDWDIIKKEKFNEFNKKIKLKNAKNNLLESVDIKSLDDEIDLILNKINFKRTDIIKIHLGLDGSEVKTLQQTGDHFNVTRERIRQIERDFIRKLKKTNIGNLKILNKIGEQLTELCPISSSEFEKFLLDNSITKKRFYTRSILSLFEILLGKNEFLKINIPKYSIANNNYIIDLKQNLKYRKIIKFVTKNFNSYGLINISFIAKKYNLASNGIIQFLKYHNDISFLDNQYIYDNDKSRNRLYNSLQKIFNVNRKINKFDLEKAFNRISRFEKTPDFKSLSKYCEKEMDATINDFEIIIPENKIDKFFYNSRKEIFSEIEHAIISSFSTEDKILSYNELTNRLINKGINANSAALYVSRNTPIIIKVAPSCYAMIGTEFEAGEIDTYYNLNKVKNKIEKNFDYDYGENNTIWVGYEINKKNRDGRSFSLPKSLYEIIKGEYKVVGLDHTIKISNGYIYRVSNEKLKNMIVLNEEIMFTFNINKKIVSISNGKDLMKEKYKQ